MNVQHGTLGYGSRKFIGRSGGNHCRWHAVHQRFDFDFFILRYFSFFILLLLPSSYISLTTFHHEMIPTQLVINLLAQREGIPFPAFVEAMLMEISFEVIMERDHQCDLTDTVHGYISEG